MATIQGLLRSLEGPMKIVRDAIKTVAAAEAGLDKARRFADICVQLKWPPPWHIPARVIDRIVDAHAAGHLSAERTAEIFASFYTPEQIEEFGRRWASYGWLSDRLPIFQEALGNHVAARYFSAVCVLLPQIEGVLREALGEKPMREKSVAILRGYQLARPAAKFFAEVVLESFDPEAEAPIPELSRHAILHGSATDYGTPIHSLKVILIGDIILSSIEENRRRPDDEVPEADV